MIPIMMGLILPYTHYYFYTSISTSLTGEVDTIRSRL
uniref:Uncharacterized protein n=1 Tax=Picea glauca TaxID=3330 RepID=A0A101LV21_PICGL|nr:hypothetical protein ABT39_MTgene2209 [Picea glauca]